MGRYLTTFSGKYGDILWSLPTVRLISHMMNQKVDFACMPPYASILGLIAAQTYIDKAFIVEDWVAVNSNHGDQPWYPPRRIERDYERTWHLTYKGHPGITAPEMSLIDFVAYQQGFSFDGLNPLPFIEPPDLVEDGYREGRNWWEREQRNYVAYAFNGEHADLKNKFIDVLHLRNPIPFVDVSQYPWTASVGIIKNAICFVGCRSANYVLAHAVGQRVICYEPNPSRNAHGRFGKVFGCPYGTEFGHPYTVVPQVHAEAALNLIIKWKEEYEHEAVES